MKKMTNRSLPYIHRIFCASLPVMNSEAGDNFSIFLSNPPGKVYPEEWVCIVYKYHLFLKMNKKNHSYLYTEFECPTLNFVSKSSFENCDIFPQ